MTTSPQNIFHDHEFVVIGLSHQTTELSMLEACALKEDQKALALRELKNRKDIVDGLLLSTCNRVEVYALGKPQALEKSLRAFYSNWFSKGQSKIENQLYYKTGKEALRHLFRVAASLDSMVLGEAQILGQFKEAFELSRQAQKNHPLLDRIARKAISSAKRVRSETNIATQALSLARIAVDLSEKIFGELADRRALLVGAGEMGDLAARNLQKRGIEELIICNRSYERAASLAQELRANVVQWNNLFSYLELVDIVVVSTAAEDFVIQEKQVRQLMSARKNRPIFFIDIAMPRNVDPRVNDIENAYLYNIEDLKNVSAENLEKRQQDLDRAEVIVEKCVESCIATTQLPETTSTLVDLKGTLDELIRQEFSRLLEAGMATHGQLDDELIERSIRSIVQKLIFFPSQFLKQSSDKEHQTLRRIFGLSIELQDNNEYRSDRHKK